jgi:capsular polysaccharide biosynthesis protein
MNNLNLKSNVGSGEIIGKEIDLKNLFKVIKKRLWIIIFITSLLTLLSGIYSNLTYSPLYQASSRIMVKANSELMNTLLVVMKEPKILEKVVKDLELSRSPESLSNQLSVGQISGSQLVRIVVVDPDPVLAAKIANATMNAYMSEFPKLYGFSDFVIMFEAKENPNLPPFNDNRVRNLILAFIIGVTLSIGFVFILDSLDDSIKSDKDLERLLGTPVLGSISKVNKNKLVKKMEFPEGLTLGGGVRWLSVKDNLLKFLKKGA